MDKRPTYRPPLPVLRSREEPLMSPQRLRAVLAYHLRPDVERLAGADEALFANSFVKMDLRKDGFFDGAVYAPAGSGKSPFMAALLRGLARAAGAPPSPPGPGSAGARRQEG